MKLRKALFLFGLLGALLATVAFVWAPVFVAVPLLIAVADLPPVVAAFVQALIAYAFASFLAFVLELTGWDFSEYLPAVVAFATNAILAWAAGVITQLADYLAALVGQPVGDVETFLVGVLVMIISFIAGYAAYRSHRVARELRRATGTRLTAIWQR